MLDAVIKRRSIRKYKEEEIPVHMVEEVLRAGLLAPSSKNLQPWKFIVVTGRSKAEMLEVFRQGLEREKNSPLLPESAPYIGGAEYTRQVMKQAPVIIFIVNTLGLEVNRGLTPDERIFELCNAQSIGAAIENMTLAATDLGLGSLWICDTCFAYQELNGWLDAGGELIAALALGYADEAPAARPRKSLEEAAEWRY